MPLTFEERRELIRYRIKRAESTYKEAEDTAHLGHWILTVHCSIFQMHYCLIRECMQKHIRVSLRKLVNIL